MDCGGGEEMVCEDDERVMAFGRGESGTVGLVGSSRENLFVVATDMPASCKDRIRSAIDPPGLRMGPSLLSLGDPFVPFILLTH